MPRRLTAHGAQDRVGEVVVRQSRARVHQPAVVAVSAGEHQPVVAAAGTLSSDDRRLPLVGERGDAHMMPPGATVDLLAEPRLQPEWRRPQQACDLDAHGFRGAETLAFRPVISSRLTSSRMSLVASTFDSCLDTGSYPHQLRSMSCGNTVRMLGMYGTSHWNSCPGGAPDAAAFRDTARRLHS